ncbi:MAG: RagB/SusD family nutrient uptake outer membrane protein [Bacteroidota bacterium]|nr:RagB/SusD family nutrient uptake outer membrane protein [Bacteroidota bacterium]
MNIRKYIVSIIVGVAILVVPMGCENDNAFLEEKSYTLNTSTFYNSPADIELGLNYGYARVQYMLMGVMHNNCSWLLMGAGLDTFNGTGQNGIGSTNFVQGLTSSDGFVDHWFRNQYYVIYDLNKIVEAIDNRDIKWNSETQKNEYRAEALFLRAWFYRNLIGLFGGVPMVTEPSDGIAIDFPRNTRTEGWEQVKKDLEFAAANLPKTTNQPGRAVRAAADHLLAEVCNSLGDFDGAIAAATRVINGTDGDYQLMTERFGTRSSEKTNRYGQTLNPYWDLFQIGNQNYSDGNKEAIWVCQYNYGTYSTGGGGNTWWRARYNMAEAAFNANIRYQNRQKTHADYNGGQSFNLFGDEASHVWINGEKISSNGLRPDSLGTIGVYGPALRPTNYFLWQVWNGDKQDFRGSEAMIQKNTYLISGNKTWPQAIKEAFTKYPKVASAADTTGIWPRLWKLSSDKRGTSSAGNTWEQYNVDWYIIRLSETYLLRAEAHLGKGNLAAASDDINEVRSRAGAQPCSANDVTLDYILDERARELFAEEHRWVTLSRLSNNPNLASNSHLNKGNVLVTRVKKYGWNYPNVTDGTTRPNIGDHQYVFPLPIGFIQANTGSDIPQNAGYDGGTYDNSK